MEYIVTLQGNDTNRLYRGKIGTLITVGTRTFIIKDVKIDTGKATCIIKDKKSNEEFTVSRPPVDQPAKPARHNQDITYPAEQ